MQASSCWINWGLLLPGRFLLEGKSQKLLNNISLLTESKALAISTNDIPVLFFWNLRYWWKSFKIWVIFPGVDYDFLKPFWNDGVFDDGLLICSSLFEMVFSIILVRCDWTIKGLVSDMFGMELFVFDIRIRRPLLRYEGI